MSNPIYCSTSTLAQANGGRWFELDVALDVLPRVQCDGFEFCIFAEWERGQLLDGQAIRGYSFQEVAERVRQHAQYFKAVHANKEIAYQYLASSDSELHRQGLAYLEQAVELAGICNAQYVVLHAWDMNNALESYRQVMKLIGSLSESQEGGVQEIPLSIETIPGPINPAFCAEVLDLLPAGWGLTLDLFHTRERAEFEDWLQWARYFTNVHVQCYIDVNEQGDVVLGRNRFGVIDIVGRVREVLRAGYRGPLTLEPNGLYTVETLNKAVELLRNVAAEEVGTTKKTSE